MTFGQLEIFAALADAGGFTAAAARLGISQSAVSHAIRALEADLGVPLVNRAKARPEPTEIGALLLTRARAVLGLAETMRQEAAAYRGVRLGSLRIGSFGPTATLHLLPNLLAAFRADWPGVEVLVEEGDDETVLRWLEERRVDVAFAVLPDERFDAHPLIEDQFVALLPQDDPLAAQPAVTLRELCARRFIMTEAGSQGVIGRLFSEAGLRPKIHARTAQVLSTLAMVSRGEGAAVVAELAMPPVAGFEGFAVKPLDPPRRRSVGLALLPGAPASPAAQAFVRTAAQLRRGGGLLTWRGVLAGGRVA
ncbi:LysR family transcriptional regulator [Oceanicella actignis]|uniref:DNA-binding transcriptional regulator, LysR family n=1 Tax=Oceanicella actignis TaxID=1189325 RepID=A0A1M7T9B0_9RHOB|nr:LysR family transcriptional regulator [Oceanicella actignis]TYO89122.1 DNA-binding transcriptional LysR family regulator [Oceanicella actignis]SET50403.1 DNA-binding transcriptional regulator, LysR family [Oceanicella actignis]SHN67278.1 DNA-binding transcriptional regulator, LysR family [Oceanicella actignis]